MDRAVPQSPDAERAVLGAILINNHAYDRVAPIIDVEDFFKDAHRTAFAAMKRMAEDRRDIETLTLKEELICHGQLEQAGGVAYISAHLDVIPDVANVERYARIVKEKSKLRQLLAIGSEAMARAMDTEGETADVIAAEIADKLDALQPANAADSLLPLDEVASELARMYASGGVPRGFSTGMPSLDSYYTVAPGAWTLITGIPGHGKSGWLDQLSLNLSRKHDWQILMFSAENFPPESHLASIIEKHIGLPFNDGPTARMRPADVERGLAFVDQHFRFIDPAAERMTIDRILSIATGLAEKRPVNVLTIDPWNELHHEYAEGLTETQYISIQLTKVRRWARKHNAHVYLVAHPKQMQKEKDSGKYAPPTPYDVSGGAHWRNKADYCLCVYRDISDGEDDATVSIFVQKVRRREMGRVGQVTLKYDKVTSEYHDPAQPRRLGEYYD